MTSSTSTPGKSLARALPRTAHPRDRLRGARASSCSIDAHEHNSVFVVADAETVNEDIE